MKKLLFSLLLLSYFANIVLAQDKASYRDKIATIFSEIQLKEIPSGFLSEFSSPVFDLKLLESDTTTLNCIQWRMAYANLMSAKVNDNTKMLHLKSVNRRIKGYQEKGLVPVAILNYDLERFKSDALEKNLVLYQNNKLFDVSGKNQTPFETFSVFAAAPMQKVSRKGDISYIFPSKLFFTNRGEVSKLEVDFDDGKGWQTLKWEAPVTVTYAEKGVKEIQFRLTFAEGKQRVTKSSFYVERGYQANGRWTDQADVVINIPATAEHSGGVVFITFSNPSNTGPLQNPLILLNGLDPFEGALFCIPPCYAGVLGAGLR